MFQTTHPLQMSSLTQPMTIPCGRNRFAYASYKLATADISQVCDGQHTMSFNRSNVGESSQAINRIASDVPRLLGGYFPIRAKGTSQDFPDNPLSNVDVISSTEPNPSSEDFFTESDSFKPRKRHSYPNSSSSRDDDGLPPRHDLPDNNQNLQNSKINKPRCNGDSIISSTESSSSSEAYSSGSNPFEPRKRHSCPNPECSKGEDDGLPRAMLRQKYQPRHRSTLNHSIQGIMRPSRYSAGTTQRRSSSMPARKLSFDTLNSLTSDISSSDRNWVPMGVVFSDNMEVYVFEK